MQGPKICPFENSKKIKDIKNTTHFWPPEGPAPLYVAEKARNPYGFVLRRAPILKSLQNPDTRINKASKYMV